MTDIVERLRQGIERCEEGDAELAMDRAADEIERLRKSQELSMSYANTIIELRAEIELLCMALKAIQEDPEAGLNIHAITRTALAPTRT
jgi:hypothetical protein